MIGCLSFKVGNPWVHHLALPLFKDEQVTYALQGLLFSFPCIISSAPLKVIKIKQYMQDL
jgi:hypothetical protein